LSRFCNVFSIKVRLNHICLKSTSMSFPNHKSECRYSESISDPESDLEADGNHSTNDSESDDGVNPNAHLYTEFARIDAYFSCIYDVLFIQMDGGPENRNFLCCDAFIDPLFVAPFLEDDSDDESVPSLVSADSDSDSDSDSYHACSKFL